jgi:flavin-dependent dehydrogenase
MDRCDVLIVGGGPAGSTCARQLRDAGLDVVVVDRELFPRDKVCGGWITPQVVAGLALDVDEYRRNRTFQPITGFLTGVIGGEREIATAFPQPVSYGIRRSEFDDYLLRRSGARLRCGVSVSTIRRTRGEWIVNDTIAAPLLVGAAGHFCPVARWVNAAGGEHVRAPLVAAQETEFALDPRDAHLFTTAAHVPELYFSRDMRGYGWCFRKQNHLNVGLGRVDRRSLPGAVKDFVAFLERREKIPRLTRWRWRGHAYFLSDALHRRRVADGVLLIGDSAGLAYAQSGEGIRPAVESGLLAARTILEARGRYSAEQLRPYQLALDERFGAPSSARTLVSALPVGVSAPLARLLLNVPAFVRHVALDRWFLHADMPPLAA